MVYVGTLLMFQIERCSQESEEIAFGTNSECSRLVLGHAYSSSSGSSWWCFHHADYALLSIGMNKIRYYFLLKKMLKYHTVEWSWPFLVRVWNVKQPMFCTYASSVLFNQFLQKSNFKWSKGRQKIHQYKNASVQRVYCTHTQGKIIWKATYDIFKDKSELPCTVRRSTKDCQEEEDTKVVGMNGSNRAIALCPKWTISEIVCRSRCFSLLRNLPWRSSHRPTTIVLAG